MDRQDLHLCADRWAMDPGQYAGPLIAYTEQISGIGYDVGTVIQLTGAARHFCAWLHLSGHAMDAPDDRLVESFARHRCRCGGYRPSTPLSHRYLFKVRRFVRFLADIGLVTRTRPDDTSDDRHVEAYLDWLFRHRGLSPLTVHSHRKMLRQLLPVIGTDATRYDAAGLRAAILDRRGRVGRGAMKQTTTVLRSWLRYHAAHGTCPAALVRAVPTIAHWRGSHLPRGLHPVEVERLIASCDIGTATGRRDRAILLLLARLGLRAEDLRALRLDQIDWARGELCLVGKGRRRARLPLPQEVGDALLAWLKDGRPPVSDPHVFLRYAAPWHPFTESAAISKIVARAIDRAGVTESPSRGAHVLRHSAARALLEDGVSLEIISTVLRHRTVATTAIYTKVDTSALRAIAQVWLGERPC